MKIDIWTGVGILGQVFFSLRFIIQWIQSEKSKKSVIPYSFWIYSIVGSTILLVYAIKRADPVFILGQSAGLLIYARNIHLIKKVKSEE